MNRSYYLTNYSSLHQLRRQKGAALIVSLIILAVVTILGVTNMQSSNTELKLTASMRDRGVAFEAAEAALAIVEENLSNSPPSRMQLISTCSISDCFNATCEGGRCFDGSYALNDPEYFCEVADYSDTSRRVEFWSDSNLDVWRKDTRHRTVQIDNLKTDVKYIVEFLCYVPRDEDTIFSLDGDPNGGAPLYRITALAEGNGARAAVALQSTYKVLNGH